MPVWRLERVSPVLLLCDSPVSDSHLAVGIETLYHCWAPERELHSSHFYLSGPKTLILMFLSFYLLFPHSGQFWKSKRLFPILSTDWQAEVQWDGKGDASLTLSSLTWMIALLLKLLAAGLCVRGLAPG